MSPYEYAAALIHIEHCPDVGQNSTKGCNKWFEFNKASNLHPWWVQKLGSAMPTLILSSRRPKWPGLLSEEASDEEQKKHQEQLNNFGAYYVGLFWPRVGCYAGSDCDSTKYNWSGFCSMAKGFREEKTVIGYARLDTLAKTMFAMVVTSSTKEKIKTWRGRNRCMWTDTEKANNHFNNKYIRKQKEQFQTLLLDNVDLQDVAGRKKLLDLLHIRVKEQQLRQEVRESAPDYSQSFVSQTPENRFYNSDCYRYLIHHVRSVTCDFENVHRTICAAKHKRHPSSEKDNPATDKGPQISESAYKKKLQGILSTFIARLEESAAPLTKK